MVSDFELLVFLVPFFSGILHVPDFTPFDFGVALELCGIVDELLRAFDRMYNWKMERPRTLLLSRLISPFARQAIFQRYVESKRVVKDGTFAHDVIELFLKDGDLIVEIAKNSLLE